MEIKLSNFWEHYPEILKRLENFDTNLRYEDEEFGKLWSVSPQGNLEPGITKEIIIDLLTTAFIISSGEIFDYEQDESLALTEIFSSPGKKAIQKIIVDAINTSNNNLKFGGEGTTWSECEDWNSEEEVKIEVLEDNRYQALPVKDLSKIKDELQEAGYMCFEPKDMNYKYFGKSVMLVTTNAAYDMYAKGALDLKSNENVIKYTDPWCNHEVTDYNQNIYLVVIIGDMNGGDYNDVKRITDIKGFFSKNYVDKSDLPVAQTDFVIDDEYTVNDTIAVHYLPEDALVFYDKIKNKITGVSRNNDDETGNYKYLFPHVLKFISNMGEVGEYGLATHDGSFDGDDSEINQSDFSVDHELTDEDDDGDVVIYYAPEDINFYLNTANEVIDIMTSEGESEFEKYKHLIPNAVEFMLNYVEQVNNGTYVNPYSNVEEEEEDDDTDEATQQVISDL